MRTRIPLITMIVAMLLLIPAAAGAALVDEQRPKGEQGESRIHQLLGRRYTGCYTSTGSAGARGASAGGGSGASSSS